MRKAPLLGLAGLVGTGLIAIPMASSATTAGDPTIYKRDEQTVDLVLVADDDDDDTNDNTKGTNQNTNSGITNGTQNTFNSINTNDNTNSRNSAVSRDRDKSRGDLTKDFTRDGGDKTRDRSANFTNDRSKNDTRR